MAASGDTSIFVPKGRAPIPLGPLNKGVHLDVAADELPQGALLDTKNVVLTAGGLKRRSGLSQFLAKSAVDYPPIVAAETFYNAAGTQEFLVVDQKHLYKNTTAGLQGIYWTYSTGTVANTGAVVTGSGSAWATATNELQAGDTLMFDPSGTPDGPYEILSIDSDTQVTLTEAPGTNHAGGTAYEIRRAFKPAAGRYTDIASKQGGMFFADGSRFLYGYDGSTFGDYASAYSYLPHAVTFFKDRIWIGYTIEGGDPYMQRIRWSDVDLTTFQAGSYVDLPYVKGAILRLVPYGDYLVVYCSDGILVGRQSNDENAPYYFEKADTKDVGLVGMRGVVSAEGAHLFIGEDNIYVFQGQPSAFQCTPIGDAITAGSIDVCTHRTSVVAEYDPVERRFAFGFPTSGESFESLWFYDVRTKEWYPDYITGEALVSSAITASLTWDSLSGTWDTFFSGAGYPTWDSMAAVPQGMGKMYVSVDGGLFSYEASLTADYNGGIIPFEVSTQEIGGQSADTLKEFSRFTVVIKEALPNDLKLALWGSNNSGRTWKSLGTVVIDSGDIAGKVDFKLLAANARFRVKSTVASAQFVVKNFAIWAKERGTYVPGKVG